MTVAGSVLYCSGTLPVPNDQAQLVTDLIALQRESEWPDREMADALGISLETWTKIRHGQRRPGLRFLGRVLHVFPSFRPAILLYIRDRGKD